MGTRRRARESALQLLYQLDVGGGEPSSAIDRYWGELEEPLDVVLKDFARTLVEGVWGRREEIDDMIASYSTNWKISRMAAVDKNILRMAIYELLYCVDIPVKVTLNEAIEIAKKYGTTESGAFVNGILDNVARDRTPQKFHDPSHEVPK